MSLKDYNLNELCNYYNIECSLPNQRIDYGIERFYKFRQEFLKLLKNTHYGSLKGFLQFQFDILPSLIKAANRIDANYDRKVPEEMRYALEILKESKGFIPLNLMRIPLELLHYHYFKKIPCKEPSLEVGCGNGIVSNYIFKGNRITVGSDPSILSMIDAKRDGKVHRHYIGIDGNAIPFSDAVFNTLIAVHSIDHVSDRKQVLSEMSRVLQPGGWMAISDLSEYSVSFLPLPGILQNIGYSDLGDDFIKYYFHNGGLDTIETKSPDWYSKTLTELGFEDIKISYFMSERLARISFLFFSFELLAAERSFALAYTNDRYLKKQIHSFAEEVYLPLIAEDPNICSKENKGFNLFVQARKKVNTRSNSYLEENILKLMNCPLCKGLLSIEKDYISCIKCAEKYPIIEDIYFITPSAAEAYRYILEQVGNKKIYKKMSLKKRILMFLLNSKVLSIFIYKIISFIETFPILRKNISKFYGG